MALKEASTTPARSTERPRRRCPRDASERKLLEPGKAIEGHVAEARGGPVLGAHDRVRDRPGDPDVGIVPADARLVAGAVGRGALVRYQRSLADPRKPMSKPRRHVHLAQGRSGKRDPRPPAEGRRSPADIDGDVEHFAP